MVTDALGVADPCQRGSVVGIQLAGLSCGGEWEASGSSGHSQAWYWKADRHPETHTHTMGSLPPALPSFPTCAYCSAEPELH